MEAMARWSAILASSFNRDTFAQSLSLCVLHITETVLRACARSFGRYSRPSYCTQNGRSAAPNDRPSKICYMLVAPIHKMAPCEVQTPLLEQEATRTIRISGCLARVVLGRYKPPQAFSPKTPEWREAASLPWSWGLNTQ